MKKNETLLVLSVMALIIAVSSIYVFVIKKGKINPLAASNSPTMILNPVSGSLRVGDTLDVAINIDTANIQTDGTLTILQFDPNYLEVVDAAAGQEGTQITAGTFYPMILSNSVDNGKIVFKDSSDVANGTSISGMGTLATIRFKAKQVTNKTDVNFVFTAGSNSTDSSGLAEHGTGNNILSSVGNASYAINSPSVPAPTVDLKIDGQDGTINKNQGEQAILNWSSTGATACNATGSWSGPKDVSGSQSTDALMQSSTYQLACTGAGGSVSDSVSVNVNSSIAPPLPIDTGSSSTKTTTNTVKPSLLAPETSSQIASIPDNIKPANTPQAAVNNSQTLLANASMKPWMLWFLYAIIPAFLSGATIYLYLKRRNVKKRRSVI